jgi:carboxylate-amine ligase
LTFGVEEEYLLLEPDGALAPVARDVLRVAGGDRQLTPEFMAYQLEAATTVCTSLDELRSELVRLRLLAAAGADHCGVRLVAAGLPPYRTGAIGAVTAEARYLEIARRFPQPTAAAGGACACQVHVGVPDRDLRVRVLARLRPWLPTLLALGTNSAIVNGTDSGWSSYRYRMLLNWPTFRPPRVWASADRYDRTVEALIGRGAAVGAAGIYLLARLSARYPTVEVRVADACLTAEDAVLFAAVVRALVATVASEQAAEPLANKRISAGLLTAARRGMSTNKTKNNLPDLIQKIMPVLETYGDADEVRSGLARLRRTGTGADRQRRLWTRSATPEAFVAALSDASVPAVAHV